MVADFPKNLSDLEHFQHPDQFGNWLGYKVVSADLNQHKTEVELKIREDHLSPAGRAHGGVISAFFDFACGSAVFTTLGPRDFCSTVELKVNYLRPIILGDHLIAKSEVIFRGKRLCVLHSLAYCQGKAEPVAMATATFHVGTTQPGQT